MFIRSSSKNHLFINCRILNENKELYKSVKSGKETEIVLKEGSRLDYRERLNEELKEIRESEMWQAGKAARSLRPENNK